jgi:sterol desaturase/sphingolipid hydroxylase (fatty acid hydroxylase superfamily)
MEARIDAKRRGVYSLAQRARFPFLNQGFIDPMLDADQLHHLYDRLWVYFVDRHLLGQPALILLGAVSLMVCEALFRDWNKTVLYRLFVRRSTSAKIDVAFALLQSSGLALFVEIALTFGVSIGAARLGTALSNYLSWRITLPSDGVFQIAFSVMVYFLVFDFVGYWVHRLYHTPLFWHLHRFHHSAPELNFITSLRTHPAETSTRLLFLVTPLTFLNVSDSILLTFLVLNEFVNFCEHSELPWSWGWVGRWIFASPTVHQLHHSIDEEHRDKNFGECPLWDHVFGTWYDGEKKPSAYGVSANGIPDRGYDERPIAQFVDDLLAFYRDLMAGTLRLFRRLKFRTRASSGNGRSLARDVATARSAEERIGA